jgi:hypothetical protein
MALTAPPSKLPWNNRFRMPTDAELLSAFQAPTLGYLKTARERFKAGPSVLEMICWHGTWKWTFAYRSIALMQCQWAYILPDPAKAQICVPVLEATLADLQAQAFDQHRHSKTSRRRRDSASKDTTNSTTTTC